jgi:hypothetical protein
MEGMTLHTGEPTKGIAGRKTFFKRSGLESWKGLVGYRYVWALLNHLVLCHVFLVAMCCWRRGRVSWTVVAAGIEYRHTCGVAHFSRSPHHSPALAHLQSTRARSGRCGSTTFDGVSKSTSESWRLVSGVRAMSVGGLLSEWWSSWDTTNGATETRADSVAEVGSDGICLTWLAQ